MYEYEREARRGGIKINNVSVVRGGEITQIVTSAHLPSNKKKELITN